MIAGILKYLLSLYKKTNGVRRPCCRFYPSCSEYAVEAVGRHGLLPGIYLALRRLIRCNQFFPGGFDPVPDRGKLALEMFHVKP